jgi:hypothetical protein
MLRCRAGIRQRGLHLPRQRDLRPLPLRMARRALPGRRLRPQATAAAATAGRPQLELGGEVISTAPLFVL